MSNTYTDGKHATETLLTKVSFGTAGNTFIYSDNPETIRINSLTYHYGFGLMANVPKDVEFYMNCNKSGTLAGRAGIAIKNQSGAAATITVKGAQKHIRRDTSLLSKECADLEKLALTTSERTIPLANGAAVFLDNSTFTFASNEIYYKLAYGRYTITSNRSDVYVRTFSGNSGTTAASVFNVSSMAPASGTDQFCGTVGYNRKTLTFPATPGTAFLIGEWWHSGSAQLYNQNEYIPVTPKPGGGSVHMGNYGVIYDITFTGASGKYVKLMPRNGSGEACILYSINNGAWNVTTRLSKADIDAKKCWSLPLPTSSTNLRLMIPGANNGNVKVEVCS